MRTAMPGRSDELSGYLAPLRRRLRLRDGWILAQRTLWMAMLIGLLVQVVGRIWPVRHLWLWSLLPLALWSLATLLATLLKPLSALRTAHRVDQEMRLKERLSTQLALASYLHPGSGTSSNVPFRAELVNQQRQDALQAARAIQPRRDFPLPWLRRPLLIAGLLFIAAATLALLPNPMDAVLAHRDAVRQAAEAQAEKIEALREEVQESEKLSPQERQELLNQLAQLAEELRANPGDLEEALADISRLEEGLKRDLLPGVDAHQSAIAALSSQLQSLARQRAGAEEDGIQDAQEALEELSRQLEEMDSAERQEMAGALAQIAAQAGQAGEAELAQALGALSGAAQSGDPGEISQASQAASQALGEAQQRLIDQAALQRALSELEASRQALAQAGESGALAQAQSSGQGQNPGSSQGQGQGQGQGQSQGQGGGQPGGGGGTTADTLPPGTSQGQADEPQGEGRSAPLGELDPQVFAPRQRAEGQGGELVIPGQETDQGQTQVRESQDPLPGSQNPSLVPYSQVYYDYLEAANQVIEQSAIPPALRDYVREYFSQLEP